MKRASKNVPAVRPFSFKGRISFMVLGAVISCIESLGQSAQNATPQPSSGAAQLAQELTNPVASLISVPFQNAGRPADQCGRRFAMLGVLCAVGAERMRLPSLVHAALSERLINE